MPSVPLDKDRSIREEELPDTVAGAAKLLDDGKGLGDACSPRAEDPKEGEAEAPEEANHSSYDIAATEAVLFTNLKLADM